MALKDAFGRSLGRAAEPRILFPLIALFVLAAIWGTTCSVLRVLHADAEHAAAVSSRELLGTYEAQVLRAVREIDQALTLVASWPERQASHRTLADLKNKGLLPPELICTVTIADHDGTVIESTRPIEHRSVAEEDTFRTQRNGDMLYIGALPRGPTGEQKLQFSRRLSTADGSFDGVVIVSIDADFFVSGYDAAKLGEHGVLGLLGTDGVFRVRRIGDAAFSGDRYHSTTALAGSDAEDTHASVTRAPGMGSDAGPANADYTAFRSPSWSDCRWMSKWRARGGRCMPI